jgi:YCII-related domain
MSKFIFTYRSAKGYDAMTDPEGLAAWGTFLNDVISPHVVDPGYPVFEPSILLGETGPSTRLGGYSIVDADDLDSALSMAKHCPTVARGGGVEVGVLAALPEEHPAEQIRSHLADP